MTPPVSVLCTLPATSHNSQYTLNAVAKGDGTTVGVGTSFTLLCNQGYTFKNANNFVQSCTDGLKTEDIKNECFSEFSSFLISSESCLFEVFSLFSLCDDQIIFLGFKVISYRSSTAVFFRTSISKFWEFTASCRCLKHLLVFTNCSSQRCRCRQIVQFTSLSERRQLSRVSGSLTWILTRLQSGDP